MPRVLFTEALSFVWKCMRTPFLKPLYLRSYEQVSKTEIFFSFLKKCLGAKRRRKNAKKNFLFCVRRVERGVGGA